MKVLFRGILIFAGLIILAYVLSPSQINRQTSTPLYVPEKFTIGDIKMCLNRLYDILQTDTFFQNRCVTGSLKINDQDKITFSTLQSLLGYLYFDAGMSLGDSLLLNVNVTTQEFRHPLKKLRLNFHSVKNLLDTNCRFWANYFKDIIENNIFFENISLVEFQNSFLYVSGKRKTSVSNVSNEMSLIYNKILKQIKDTSLIAGSPFAVYYDWKKDSAFFEAGIPVKDSINLKDKTLKLNTFNVKRAIKAIHKGPYSQLSNTYEKINDWIKYHKVYPTGPPWEVYLTGIDRAQDSTKWITEIYFPVE